MFRWQREDAVSLNRFQPCFVVVVFALLVLSRNSDLFAEELQADEPKRPNIVVFLSDDHTWRDSSVYGSPDIKTPNMKRLAAEGMTFNRAFVASPSCAPSRAALLTGLYPSHNRAEANHARPLDRIKKLPAYLQELGYEVVSFGKVGHYRQTTTYGFDLARHFNYHEDVAVPEAIKWLNERESERPLCMFVGTNWPHVPWPEDTEGIDPKSLVVPPNHVDAPGSREWRARYVAAVNTMDRELGEVYNAARAKFGDDVFFLHTSDHGAQWPFGKWSLYDDGIRTPMIASWPGHIEQGVRTDAMVSWLDILPTLVDVAGGEMETEVDGQSFLPVLKKEAEEHRHEIFTTHSGDGNFNVYPIRSVRTDDNWKYIRNLHPEFLFTSHVTKAPADSGYWSDWVAAASEITSSDASAWPGGLSLNSSQIVTRYQQRPYEELYDLNTDPYELNNLAENESHLTRLDQLRSLLDEHISEVKDSERVFGQPQRIDSNSKPIVWIFSGVQPAESAVDSSQSSTAESRGQAATLSTYLLLANEFDTRGIVVADSTATWAREYFGEAYKSGRKNIAQAEEVYPTELHFFESAALSKTEVFSEEQSYESLEERDSIQALIDLAMNEPSMKTINVLCWGYLTEPAILIKHCLDTNNRDLLKRFRFIVSETRSPLHHRSQPNMVTNCVADREACFFLKRLAREGMISMHECGAIGYHGLVKDKTLEAKALEQLSGSKLGKILIDSRHDDGTLDLSASATYWMLLGEYGITLNHANPDGTLTAENERRNQRLLRENSQRIWELIISRAKAAAEGE